MNNKDFIFHEKLGSSLTADIFRGESIRQPGQALRLKVIKPRFTAQDTESHLQQQLSYLAQLNIAQVTVPTLHTEGGSLILAQALPQAQTLDSYLQQHRALSILATLELGIALAGSLAERHKKNWIHKGVKPGNILLSTDFSPIELIDDVRILEGNQFGQFINDADYCQQSLPYQSPEQSERVRLGLNYNSDLYSLGAVFYHCLTGRPPFFSSDPLSLIHSHLAEIPVPVIDLRPECPPSLSQIVALLLEKNPDKRYQTASGLKADLHLLMDKIRTNESTAFQLKQHDHHHLITPPSIMLGREQEQQNLLDMYQRACSGQFGIAFISGHSGIGKSRLVEALELPIITRQGHFVSGKYNQFSKHQPYSALAQAIGKLIRQIMTEDDAQLALWKQRILEKIGANGQLLINIIPEIAFLIGPQPSSTPLPPLEAQKQFHALFCRFLGALANAQSPLVLFIDDLQWCDDATLDILENISSDPTHYPYLFLIVAYRSNEISSAHRIYSIKNSLVYQTHPFVHINLKALDKTAINELLANILNTYTSRTQDITEFLYPVTGGNPLLVYESLRWLYEQGGLFLSEDGQQWHWQASNLRHLHLPDTVQSLFLEKLKQLPQNAQTLLATAALWGGRFEAQDLADSLDMGLNELFTTLADILAQHILLIDKTELYFFHDQLQAAATHLFSDEQKHQSHQKIARHLIRKFQDRRQNQHTADKAHLLFAIVEHLQKGRVSQATEEQLLEEARFNYLAGLAAMNALAHQESYHYLTYSSELTSTHHWQLDYPFMRSLHKHLARAALILGEQSKANLIVKTAMKYAQNNLDRAQFLLEQITISNSLGHFNASVTMGREGCQLLDCTLPETEQDILTETTTLVVPLVNPNVMVTFASLPEATDPKTITMLDLYSELLAPSFLSGQFNLYFLLSGRAIALALQRGQIASTCSPLGTLAFYFYAQNRFELALQYENRMLALAEQNPETLSSIRALTQGLWVTLHHTHPIDELQTLALNNIRHGIKRGELNYTGLTHVALVWYQLTQGEDLAKIQRHINDCVTFCTRFHLSLPLAISESMQYALTSLWTDSSVTDTQNEITEKLQSWGNEEYFAPLATYFCYKAMMAYFSGDYARAELLFIQAESHLAALSGTVIARLWVVYRYLCGLKTGTNSQQAAQLQQVREWVSHGDMLKPYLALMQAETIALDGSPDAVRNSFLIAIDSAHAQNYCFLEAHLHHRLGSWLEQQSQHSSAMYLAQALRLYKNCHADFFAQQLMARFEVTPLIVNVNQSVDVDSAQQEKLDSAFLLQATQSIMQERDFNTLIQKVLATAMERVGAKTGYLLTLEQSTLTVRAMGKKNAHIQTKLVTQDAVTAENFCIEIARYTLRSNSVVVLENASTSGEFTHSLAVRRYQLKSVLAIPLINQGRTLGLIYLENSLIPAVFDTQQVALISLLTTQAAIALDNSLLISDLKNTQNILSQREQNLAITLNSIGDGVIVSDASGHVTLLNPIAEKLTGWHFNEAKGKPVRAIFNIIDSNTKDLILNPVDKVLSTGETVYLSNHTTLIAKNGQQHHIADSAAPIRDHNNQIMGMVLVFNDVTEAYRLRKEIADSHKKLSQVMGDMHAMVATLTPDGAITFINNKPLCLASMSHANVLNQKLWKSFWFNYDKSVQQQVQNACQSAAAGNQVYCDVPMQTLDGLIWIEFGLHPVKDDKGDVELLVWEGRDITSRKLAENTLKEQKTEQSLILNNLADAVITIDSKGRIQSFNSAAEKIFAYSADEIMGQTVNTLMTSADAGNHDQYMGNYFLSGKSKIMGIGREMSAKRKNGEHFPIHLSIAELPPANDGSKRFVASIQDLTQRKQQQEILQRSQKMDALGKLTGGIAHDYNNMLGVILGYCDLLEPALMAQAKQLNFLKQIRHAGERGTKLTQKLLSYSRQKPADADVVNINQLLLAQQEMLAKTLTARIQLTMQLNAAQDSIKVNLGDLEDCILNLCINAMHAMEDMGRLTLKTQTINLDAKNAVVLNIPEGQYVVLTIEDTGVGMSEEIKSRIFDPFFSTKGDKGTGLGLSQVYGFMERSRGAIKVFSELGHGATFSLYFPVYTKNNLTSNPGNSQASLDTVTGTETILVVDDEIALLELTKEILLQQGYQVLCADNASDAIELLGRHAIALVLSDVIMPDMNGYQLARWIQQHHPHIHIQLISGFDDETVSSATDKILNAQRLSKPVKAELLLSRIRKLLDTPIEI